MTTKRIVSGAHYGLKEWLAQRITALMLVTFTLVMLTFVLSTKEMTYSIWASFFAASWVKVLTLLTMLALVYHAWIGTRDIYMDYIKPVWIRLSFEVCTIVALLGYLCWLGIILWRV